MTIYNGKTAAFAATTASVLDSATNSWSVETSSDVADGTNMNDDWSTPVAGLTDFSGSVELDADSAADYVSLIGDADTATFYLLDADVPNLSGTVIITGITETVTIEDIGKLSVSVEGNDAAGLVLTSV